jgi:hypothetical protein
MAITSARIPETTASLTTASFTKASAARVRIPTKPATYSNLIAATVPT